MPATNGNVGPDWDGSFIPTCPFQDGDASACQVVGGCGTFVLL